MAGTTTPWFTRTLKRIQAWGFNAIGDYSHLAFLPVGNQAGGPSGAAVKMPFILMLNATAKANIHPDVCGYRQPIKNILAGVPSTYSLGAERP